MGRAGQALKQVLKKHDISQSELADEMDVDRSTINRWVNETRDPTAESIVIINNALKSLNPKAGKEFIKLFLGQ
jgi:transcriptional regulator with XRE-family HTH domain